MDSLTDLRFVRDDGGREAAGFRGEARDCVTRAIAIASGRDYLSVYNDLAAAAAHNGGSRSARNGVKPLHYKAYIGLVLGWEWEPTMKVGAGCKVHLRADELPTDLGPLIVRLSRHLVAVVDGEIRDTHDPSRGGTRCVYGYWFSR